MHVPARPMGDISHCAEFSGPPKAACEAAANAPAPVMGDISHCAEFSGPPKAACEAAASAPTPMGDPCMVVPAGPDRDACYATTPAPGAGARFAAPGMAPGTMANGHENADGNNQGGKSYCDRTPDDPHCNDNRNYMPEECKKEGDKPSWC